MTAARGAIEASPLISDEKFTKYEAGELKRLAGEKDAVRDAAKKLRTEFKKVWEEVKWVWPKVREHLAHCGVLIGPSGIEIRLYHPPTALNSGYSRAKQRIYLLAALGLMDDLQRRVGGGRVTRLTPERPLPPDATGERVFVLNPSQEQADDGAVLAWALDQANAAGGLPGCAPATTRRTPSKPCSPASANTSVPFTAPDAPPPIDSPETISAGGRPPTSASVGDTYVTKHLRSQFVQPPSRFDTYADRL